MEKTNEMRQWETSNMKTNCFRYLAFLACTLALAGCGSEEEQSVPAFNGQYGKPTAPAFTEPSMENLQGTPQQFPSKYPLKEYPNAKVTYAWVKPNLRPGMKNQVMQQTNDAIPAVRNFYIKQLSSDGWRFIDKHETSVYSSTIWQKDGYEVEVRVSPDPRGNKNVQLMYGPMPEKRVPPPLTSK